MWLALMCCSNKKGMNLYLKAVSFMWFLPKSAIAMPICTFMQFCVISIHFQSFITVPVSHMKQQLGCTAYEGLPKISKNLLVIIWILTSSPNFHRRLRCSHLGLVYNDPSDFAIFGSTHWSLPALACLVPVAILLGSLQWIRNAALSTGVSF